MKPRKINCVIEREHCNPVFLCVCVSAFFGTFSEKPSTGVVMRRELLSHSVVVVSDHHNRTCCLQVNLFSLLIQSEPFQYNVRTVYIIIPYYTIIPHPAKINRFSLIHVDPDGERCSVLIAAALN